MITVGEFFTPPYIDRTNVAILLTGQMLLTLLALGAGRLLNIDVINGSSGVLSFDIDSMKQAAFVGSLLLTAGLVIPLHTPTLTLNRTLSTTLPPHFPSTFICFDTHTSYRYYNRWWTDCLVLSLRTSIGIPSILRCDCSVETLLFCQPQLQVILPPCL